MQRTFASMRCRPATILSRTCCSPAHSSVCSASSCRPADATGPTAASANATTHGFAMHVVQSFGNCPKYIQRRDALARAVSTAAGVAQRTPRLNATSTALVRRADTFFIATHAKLDGQSVGSDVSHRGGRQGFVRVGDDGCTLTWPDFSGNQFFNTLGNIAVEPRAGLVFPDFATGDLLHIAGRSRDRLERPRARRLLRRRAPRAHADRRSSLPAFGVAAAVAAHRSLACAGRNGRLVTPAPHRPKELKPDELALSGLSTEFQTPATNRRVG